MHTRTSWTRWLLIVAVGWSVARGMPSSGAEPAKLRVSVTRKTVVDRKGGEQRLPGARGRMNTQEVVYRFEFAKAAPDVPDELRVTYMVVVQGWRGELKPGAVKEEELVFERGRPAVVESEPVQLNVLEWNVPRGGGSGELRDRVYGWAVRVKDSQGRILFEKCQPNDLETVWLRLLEEWQKRERPVPPGGHGL